ncbi:hypothetical protein [Kutzneria sp. NPDC051319]|uniref:hypothetical protein n=1 Tax=Kutzneria sp. NPDC051319 TaxID=3155047 RepID=UPI00341F2F1C
MRKRVNKMTVVGGLRALLHRWFEKLGPHDGTAAAGQPGEAYPAELAVVNAVANESLRRDGRRNRRLMALTQQLISAASRVTDAIAYLEQLPTEARERSPLHGARATSEAAASEQTVSGHLRWFDPYRALVSARALLVLEIVFLVVEWFFWNGVLSLDLDRNLPLLDQQRVSAALLSALIPLAGIWAARLAGSVMHRRLLAYPGISRRRHRGGILAIVMFAVVLVAVGWLVYERFDTAQTALGAISVTEPVPMAILFGALVLADALSRMLLTSEVREHYRSVVIDYRRRKKRVVKAHRKHALRWNLLRAAVQLRRGQLGRIATTGAGLLLEAEAEHGDPTRTRGHRMPDTTLRPMTKGPRMSGVDEGSRGLQVPTVGHLVPVHGQVELVPPPYLEHAIASLREWPCLDDKAMAEVMRTVWAALHEAEAAPGEDRTVRTFDVVGGS